VVMASSGQNMDEQIRVRPHQLLDGNLWLDGKPEEYIRSNQGDGTILLSRAGLPDCTLPKCDFKNTYTQMHANLTGADIVDEVRRNVLQTMNITPPPGLSPVRASTQSASDELIYTLSSSTAELLVQDPSGHQIGYQPDGSFVSTIPGATYTRVTSEAKMVVVPDPLSGQYTVQVLALGSSSSFGGAGYSFVSGATQTDFTGTVNVGSPSVYTHTYTLPSTIYLPLIVK
jgi:hypothetical protein